jgi:hypothetical protein
MMIDDHDPLREAKGIMLAVAIGICMYGGLYLLWRALG